MLYMFLMFSKFTPCFPIWDGRIPQFVETWAFSPFGKPIKIHMCANDEWIVAEPPHPLQNLLSG